MRKYRNQIMIYLGDYHEEKTTHFNLLFKNLVDNFQHACALSRITLTPTHTLRQHTHPHAYIPSFAPSRHVI